MPEAHQNCPVPVSIIVELDALIVGITAAVLVKIHPALQVTVLAQSIIE